MSALALTLLVLAQMEQPRPWQPQTVKLLDAGTAPRQVLAYRLEPNVRAVLDVDAWGSWTIANDNRQATRTFPVIKTPMEMRTARDAGFGQWEVAMLPATATESLDGGAVVDPHMRQALSGVSGIVGGVVFQPTGIVPVLNFRPGPSDQKFAASGTDMEMRSAIGMEITRGLLARLTVPFPEQPIGPGATWRVERFVIRAQLQYRESATFTLVSRTKDEVNLTVSFGGLEDAQSPYPRGELELYARGMGVARVHLGKPLPLYWDDEVSLEYWLGPPKGRRVHQWGTLMTRAKIR